MLPTRQNVFRIVSKCPKMSQDVPNCPKMSKNVRADYGRKWSEMTRKTVLKVQTRQKVFRIVPKYLDMSQNVQFRRIVVRTDLFIFCTKH